MSNQIDSVSTDGIDTQYSSSKINKFKEKKEKKRNNINNSKNSGRLKSVKSAKKKLSKSKQKQMEKSNNTNNKKVKFNKKIMIIEVGNGTHRVLDASWTRPEQHQGSYLALYFSSQGTYLVFFQDASRTRTRLGRFEFRSRIN